MNIARRVVDNLQIKRRPRSPSYSPIYPRERADIIQSLAPYVPSPLEVVKKMLEYADLKPGELLYDLGSGDGRIVIMAAKEYGAKAVGIDLVAQLINESKNKALSLGLEKSTKFIKGNIFDVDLSPADVITMYLLTSSNEKLRTKLESELKTGARVVTHDFPIAKWVHKGVIELNDELSKHTLYLYVWGSDKKYLAHVMKVT